MQQRVARGFLSFSTILSPSSLLELFCFPVATQMHQLHRNVLSGDKQEEVGIKNTPVQAKAFSSLRHSLNFRSF